MPVGLPDPFSPWSDSFGGCQFTRQQCIDRHQIVLMLVLLQPCGQGVQVVESFVKRIERTENKGQLDSVQNGATPVLPIPVQLRFLAQVISFLNKRRWRTAWDARVSHEP